MRIARWLVIVALLVLVAPLSAQAGGRKTSGSDAGVTCNLPESNAEALVILSNYYPGYWWDHTHITVAVQAHPKATEEQVAAVRAAIATWSAVLLECFDGLITVTDVTDSGTNPQKAADIVAHFVPHAGGAFFAGYAICGKNECPNILVRSEDPPGWGTDTYDPQTIEWIALHELGHALGLGHATNLRESTDLMGYGWPQLGDPVLSDCDIDAIAFVFAWALEGSEPHPPAAGPYDCSLD